MATVYPAYDPNFRLKVAIKLVAGNLQANDVFREREAHLIARIEHPAIVPVYDYGEHDHDLYIVMRYMLGGSLASRIKDGVMALREATQILPRIAPALDAVHAQGIVHRGLKPGNILFDGFGNPAISDFGIAHFHLGNHQPNGQRDHRNAVLYEPRTGPKGSPRWTGRAERSRNLQFVLVGTLDEIIDQICAHHSRYGISYFLILINTWSSLHPWSRH